jgi:hypothetical protein
MTFFAGGSGGGSVALVRVARRMATVMMGDIGEEITEVELEPMPPAEAPEEPPTVTPVEPAAEPVPG